MSRFTVQPLELNSPTEMTYAFPARASPFK